jgi:hypothetical protein
MREDGKVEGFPTVAPNAGELPYAVKASGAELTWSVLVFGGGGLGLFAMTILDPRFAARWGAAPLDLICIAMAWVCALRVWRLGTPSLVLHPDRLEIRETRGWRGLARADVAGVGNVNALLGSRLLVHPRQGAGVPVRLRATLRADPVIDRWLAGAPEAVQATNARRAAITPIAFGVMAVAAAVWLGVLGKLDTATAGLAAGILVIGAVIAAVSRRGPALIGAAGPFTVLAARALLTVQLIDPWPAVAVAAGVALAAGVLAALHRAPPAKAIIAGVVAAIGTYGGLIVTDVVLDATAPAGSSLCVVEHPGALGMGWFHLFGCTAG